MLARALVWICLAGGSIGWSQAAPGFETVRPILETRCLSCHGGDAVRSGFQMVDAVHFAQGGARGPVIDAAAPAKSRLLAVIGYGDPNLAMPPSGKLPAAELAALEAWVLAGAPWPEGPAGELAKPHATESHAPRKVADWSFRPLVAPVPPEESAAAFSKHPIDAFIHHALAAREIAPTAPASADVLVRRLYLVVTGLPPTAAERAQFDSEVAQHGLDAAADKLVDHLLQSPAHAEHFARRWLDLVRYAETNGYERDGQKPNAWRYRDFVVRAILEDLPYDRFLTWQLAGDEWLAQQGDKASADERALALLATGYLHLGVYDDEPADRVQARADEIADIVDTTAQVFFATTYGCARCHDHKADPISQKDYFSLFSVFASLRGQGGREERLIADPPGEGGLTLAERDRLLGDMDRRLELLAATLPASAEPGAALPPRVLVASARGAGTTWRVHEGPVPEDWAQPAFDDAAWASARGGFGAPGTPGAIIGRRWHGEQIHLRTTFHLELIPKALHIDLHHDDHVRIYLNGQEVFARQGYITEYRRFQLDPKALEALVIGRNVLAVRCEQDFGGQFIDVGLSTGIHDEAAMAWQARLHAALQTAEPALKASIEEALAERQALLQRKTVAPYPALVASERGERPVPTYVHLRGSAHAEGEAVEPELPAVWKATAGVGLPAAVPVPGQSTGRRLALAQWMTGPGRFLTARVIANRVWQFHFGRGLSRSSGDFGALGDAPTHPELLDHLAQYLIDSNWSLRALQRHVLTSRTFRLASLADSASLQKDPRNDLFGRYDARRLSAEEYRDAVLQAEGSLSQRLYGPSVFPPLPPEVLATASRPGSAWGRSSAEDAARRSLYVHVKRSLRMPLLEAFDQPSPDMACPDRFPTNVPTQALMTLNGAFVHGAADQIAARADGHDLDARIASVWTQVFGSAPTSEDVLRQARFVQRLMEVHAKSEAQALALFAVTLLNSNAFFWVD